MNTTYKPTPLGWQQLIAGMLVHLLCYGAAQYAALFAVAYAWAHEPARPWMLPWIGLMYWFGGGLGVWWLWGRRARAVVPLFGTTLGMMLLVSANFGFRWTAIGSNMVLDLLVQSLLLSVLPITVSWLAMVGSRWRTKLVHVVAGIVLIAGAIVYMAWPSYDSFARINFQW
ncbi:hypothetical protein [uncultured Tessaracoccus sp.]|uniref:hypothetical protein n=1 Tax=uncultured Tessaracoccus sp. TaxID=905023 RepID=UPI0025E00B17|nr:hypothetical protein [uncultured Tessaracoccus sp.]